MKCTELITRDHAMIGRGLDILDGMVQKMESGLRIEIADIVAILEFLQLFVDEYHQSMEEILFPALLRVTATDSRVPRMVQEHTEERAAVRCIQLALKEKVGKQFVHSARHLSELLRTHFAGENSVLGELAQRLLSEEEDAAIVAQFMRHQPKIDPDFVYFERKYLAKLDRTAGFRREVTRSTEITNHSRIT